MANDDFSVDAKDLCGPGRCGDDSPPLFSNVQEPPPSHWGKRTSASRFESEEYLKFFYGTKKKEKEQPHGRKR